MYTCGTSTTVSADFLPGSLQVEVRPRYLRSLRNSEASREGSAVTEAPVELGSWKVVVASKLLGEVELLM